MNAMLTTRELRDELKAHLDSVTPPPADLDAVRRRGRGLRVSRFAKPGLLAVAAAAVGAVMLTQTSGDLAPDESGDVAVAEGPVDLSEGLRAFASPDERIYLGGRELPYDVVGLDTGAATTPYGIVHYDVDGLPTLLRPNGTSVQLAEGPSEPENGFSPTVKADALQPHVAFAIMNGDDVDVTVYDLEDRSVVATYGITCSDGCPDLVIDGIDSGVVFMRLTSGTTVWDYESDESHRFSGRETRVADVRNRVVLYDGARPTLELEDWRYVAGAIDAQLTFDGSHVLYWSDELTSTGVRATSTITLDLPEPATFFTFDTDGSVLAATADNPSTVFDCVLPSGQCEQIGEMSTDHGDPQFIGSDM